MIIESNDYESAFSEAESYLTASNYIIGSIQQKIGPAGTNRFLGVQYASMVNHTLAIETYFKCLSIITQTNYKAGHYLKPLFYNLKTKVQRKLEYYYEKRYLKKGVDLPVQLEDDGKKTFIEIITLIPHPFGEYRYTVDNKVYGKTDYRLDDITTTLKEVIFHYHPELTALDINHHPGI